MSGSAGLGLAIGSAEVLLKIGYCFNLLNYPLQECMNLLLDSIVRLRRIRAYLDDSENSIPEGALGVARAEFDWVKGEFVSFAILAAIPYIPYTSGIYNRVEIVREYRERIMALEDYLEGCEPSLRRQLMQLVATTRQLLESQGDSVIISALATIDVALITFKENDYNDADLIPEQAKQLLDALSRSGVPAEKRLELAEKARKIWEDWKVNFKDIEYARKRNGDIKRIGKGGAADVYLATMKVRDKNEKIIPGEVMEVAVKRLAIRPSKANIQFPMFIQGIFLQKRAQHPCIVKTLCGYWPDPDEDENEGDNDSFIEPCILMERMALNLRDAQEAQLLNSIDSKRRILGDVAAGIAHLHRRGIVHRDIKPEDVLVNVAEGRIIGRAKVCDFGVSRKAGESGSMANPADSYTRPTGSSLYMPPEAFHSSVQDSSTTSRDIWSFGVLMCEVLVPDFLKNIVRKHAEGTHAITASGEFAKEVAESVQTIACDRELGELAASCLSLQPELRPRIADFTEKLANLMVSMQIST